MHVRLHVNVDHVATLRQARGTSYPDPVQAALLCEDSGASGITVHLREDRRHIQDDDVARLRKVVRTILNLEMAASEEMINIALRTKPNLVTLVPEQREERTTEGGLDVEGQEARLKDMIARLNGAGIRVSLFIDPEPRQVAASARVGAAMIELHTGDYANASSHDACNVELERLSSAARHGRSVGLLVAAGHGLTRDNVGALLEASPEVEELNVGHAIVADSIMLGIGGAVKSFLVAMTARGRG